jgi:hypothetical protein
VGGQQCCSQSPEDSISTRDLNDRLMTIGALGWGAHLLLRLTELLKVLSLCGLKWRDIRQGLRQDLE